MLCCIRRTKPVEKNEDADQKIEQDGTPNKPEDKAHKAATKIQASFRGHITRKKMKDGEEEKEGDSPAAEEAADGKETKMEGEEAPAKEENAGEEVKKEVDETNKAKTPGADKPANSPAGTATSPVAAVPAVASPMDATAPSEPQKEEPKAEEKPKEVEAPAATPKSPTTVSAEEKKEEEKSEEKKEEARKADVPAAVSLTAEKEAPNQTNDKKDAAEESKGEENAHPDGVAEPSESKED
ncbi:hypothetical protein CHARACLAT_006296 [Characodon lateralis]|uniref:Neuromodulin n=1 Tax=Characodon lateralis TaxID=208331 RepID=A0ABU7EH31_9TELE|nr:hypothetical protein [Characodon lateralis]